MTGVNFAALVRNYTRTNSTTLPDTEIVLLANTVKDDFARDIVKVYANFFAKFASVNLVASGADINLRRYIQPADYLGMIKIQALLNGSSESAVPLTKLNLTHYKKPLTEADVTYNFSNDEGQAFYDEMNQSFWIYSGTVPVVANGLTYLYNAYPEDIDASDLAAATDLSIPSSSSNFAMPRKMHELWARQISIMWKSNKEKPLPLNEREQIFDADFNSAIQSLNNNQDDEIRGSLPYTTGQEY